jgi:hypothetical protein
MFTYLRYLRERLDLRAVRWLLLRLRLVNLNWFCREGTNAHVAFVAGTKILGRS